MRIWHANRMHRRGTIGTGRSQDHGDVGCEGLSKNGSEGHQRHEYAAMNRQFKKSSARDLPATVKRREVIKGLAATVVAGGCGRPVSAETARQDETSKKEKSKPGAIDAHSHVWTPDTSRYPLTAGYRVDQMQPPSFTAEELLAHARPAGVDRVVLIQMSFYGFDNRYMLDCMDKYRGVFGGVAVIDDHANAPEDEMRRLAARGVRGFRIYPRDMPVERWLDHDGMQRMWRRGGEDGLAMCHLVNPDALPAIDRMCAKYPDTPVVIDHFARIGVTGTIRDQDVAALGRLARHKQVRVKLSAFYALGKKQPPYDDLLPMIRRLVDAYGPERLMWATDCPFQTAAHSYRESIALLRERAEFLNQGDRDWILGRTAESLFFA